MSPLSHAERLRRRFKPSVVRVLLVGESPPNGPTFFYGGNSKLFRATQDAFGRAVPAVADLEPRHFLEAFQRMGCYLDDLCAEPVNQYSLKDPVQRKLRLQARSDGVRPLASRIRRYQPTIIAAVMKAIEDEIASAAEKANTDAELLGALPVPNRPAATEDYKSQLASLVTDWVKAGIVARHASTLA
jgi:hypothetical protein